MSIVSFQMIVIDTIIIMLQKLTIDFLIPTHAGNGHKAAITDNRFPILYYQFNCSGDEPSLDHCPNTSISEEYFTPCYDEVVYIICERKSTGFSRKYLV